MEGICAGRRFTSNWESVTIVDRDSQSLTTIKIVIAIFLFLLSGIPNVSSQQNPYAPEVDYFCDDNVFISVEYQYYNWDVTCSISNNNPHDVTVKISEEWEHNVDGLYEERTDSSYYCGGDSKEIGREINTIGSKANFAPMQKQVVQMKDELEKIKEQLLNVL